MSNHKYLLYNIIVNYGFRCHGDQRYNHMPHYPHLNPDPNPNRIPNPNPKSYPNLKLFNK